MELNPEITDRLKAIIASPKLVDSNDEQLLNTFSEQYPYFKAAHLVRLKITNDPEILTKAAVYSNGTLSHRFNQDLDDVAETTYRAIEEVDAGDKEENISATESDDQEIFDEIGEFNLSEFLPNESLPDAIPDEVTVSESPVAAAVAVETVEMEVTEQFFVPETSVESTTDLAKNEFPEIETVTPDEPEHADLSKYDDDKLPYTFLWWLAKTRAEHSQIFQPYAAPKNPIPAEQQPNGALQQQYVEHIFHLQTGIEEAESTFGANISEHVAKDQEIINAFLESDAQIKPPPVNKPDNENKARKSAEDHNDVVSETLAAIYIEQMLYRKAIDTYEKLSLKFPEKSRYFADLIKSLEKKI